MNYRFIFLHSGPRSIRTEGGILVPVYLGVGLICRLVFVCSSSLVDNRYSDNTIEKNFLLRSPDQRTPEGVVGWEFLSYVGKNVSNFPFRLNACSVKNLVAVSHQNIRRISTILSQQEQHLSNCAYFIFIHVSAASFSKQNS